MKKLCLLLAVVGVSLLAMGSTPLQVVSPTGSTSPQYKQETWLFCLDDSGNVHTEWPASPDSILEDQAGEIFVLGIVDKANPDTTLAGTSTPGAVYEREATMPYASQKYMILWFDLDRLPEDITILDAKLCVIANSTTTPGAGYGRYAILDTNKTDERLLSPASLYHSTSGYAQVWEARDSWNKPNQKAATGPWVPLLDNRHDLHDFGVKSELMGAATTAGQPATFEVDYAVQHYANYRHANAGFWISGEVASSSQTFGIRCGPAIPIARLPFLKVTFIRKAYRFPWGGYPTAFAITTDDQVADNMLWKASADSYGYKYTLYCRGDAYPFTGSNDGSKLTAAQLEEFYRDGYEIGHHSLSHAATYGLGEILADQDSMNSEVERSWLATALNIPTTAIKTFAYPAGGFNLLAINTLKDYGYILARCAGDTGAVLPAWSDADGSQWLRLDRTRDMLNVQRTFAASYLFGTAAADSFTHASIKERLYDAINLARKFGDMPLMFLVHDTKTRTTYTDGMDADDFASLCKHISDNGRVGVFTMTQIAQMYRNRNLPADPPAWATEATGDGQTAADSIWWGGGRD